MFQGIMLKEKRLPWVSSLGEAGDSSPWSRWWEPVSARRMGCPVGDPGSLTLPEMPLSSRRPVEPVFLTGALSGPHPRGVHWP